MRIASGSFEEKPDVSLFTDDFVVKLVRGDGGFRIPNA